MAFVITLGFATEPDRDDFLARTLPKVRGQQTDPPQTTEEGDGLHRVGVAVTSQTAARDLCHSLVSFLAKSKNDRVQVSWTGTDGQTHVGEVTGGAAREAEVLSVRVGAAAKTHLDQEKAADREESHGP